MAAAVGSAAAQTLRVEGLWEEAQSGEAQSADLRSVDLLLSAVRRSGGVRAAMKGHGPTVGLTTRADCPSRWES